MEDTASIAILSSKHGGLIECLGGPYRKNGKAAVKVKLARFGGEFLVSHQAA